MFAKGYEATKAANYLIKNFDPQDYELTNLKIHKSLYLIHAFCLVRYRKEFVRNHFEIWTHGPVIKSLYDSLKRYKNNVVSNQISHMNYSTGQIEIVSITELETELPSSFKEVCEQIVSRPVNDLYAEVHVVGGPWDKYIGSNQSVTSVRIPNIDIYEHYKNIYGGSYFH